VAQGLLHLLDFQNECVAEMWASEKNNNERPLARHCQESLSRRDYETGTDNENGTFNYSVIALFILCTILMGIAKTANSATETDSSITSNMVAKVFRKFI